MTDIGMCRSLIEAAKGAECNGGFVTDHLDAAEVWLDKIEETVEAQAAEIEKLKSIVQGWHYLAVGPDEMGDYYTQKQLIKASEPYASPALAHH